MVWHGQVWLGVACSGEAWQAGLSLASRGKARQGMDWRGRRGEFGLGYVRFGEVRRGKVWQAGLGTRRGTVWRVTAWQGKAGNTF